MMKRPRDIGRGVMTVPHMYRRFQSLVKISPDGFKVYKIGSDQFEGIAPVYILGLPGDVAKLMLRLGVEQ